MAGIGPYRRSVFDDLEFSGKDITPLWALEDLTNEKKVEEWFNNTVSACEDYYRDYFQTQMDNLLLYKGVQWLSADRQANRVLDRQGSVNSRNPRVVINHLADFVTQWVSRLTRYRPAVAIYPARAQQEDAEDAKIAKDVLDYIWYEQRIDEKLQEFARQMKIFGESYMWVLWNPQKGPVHPDWQQAALEGKRVPIMDSMGQPVLNEKGEPMTMQNALHVGDVDYVIDAPWHVFDEPCRSRGNINWSIRWYLEDVEYVKAKYPDLADQIKPDLDINSLYVSYRLDVGALKSKVVVYELYHRSHEFMEKGRFIKRVKNVILENTDLPYEHGQIPYLYMADIDVPDQIRGMSFFQQLFPIQHQINACASLIYKSLVLFAHPKLVIQDGSVDIQNLLNESTIVSYSGGVPPTLLNQTMVANELFTYLNKLEETAEKLSGVFTMSRGQAPSGVRAAKALRVLDEQEDKRAYTTAIKYNNIGLVENARMTLSTAGTYYDDSDGRLIQVVGKDNEYKIRQFQVTNLTKPFNIRIENTTALSQSPAARIDEITELMNIRFDPMAPISREQFIQLLDLTASDQFKDIVTRAIRCAESENDDFIAGRPVSPPTETEDLIAHWKVHSQVFQGREYKELLAPEKKAALEEHFLVTEYLMYEKANGIMDSIGMPLRMGNPVFAQKLMVECPDFPMLLKTPTPPPMMGMGMGAGGPGGPMPQANGTLQPSPIDNGAGLEQGAETAPPPLPPQPSNQVRQ
ncbi:MAG: hypothetical protein BWY21_00362 [Parcubacteria group bacterium ADurb.Bin216]|nr:MAG: hypothetical protein BWY21_00362 [Parcubacteria group bacterium ADurb.Bin216]